MSLIANRNLSLLGEVTESNYEAGRYFLGGNELAEQFTEMQRDVFAFVSDQDRVVTVSFILEVGPEEDLQQHDRLWLRAVRRRRCRSAEARRGVQA